MYGKTYKLHNSAALAPAEALLVSSSLAFDGLHDDIKFFILACFYWKLLKKRRPHGEHVPTIARDIFCKLSFLNIALLFKFCIVVQLITCTSFCLNIETSGYREGRGNVWNFSNPITVQLYWW